MFNTKYLKIKNKKIFLASALLAFLIFLIPIKGYVSDKNPVILVPGIGASWNWDKMIGKVFGDSWGFFPGVHIYDSLIGALENAGFDVYICYYDWRESNGDTAFSYLKQKIDEVKAITGKDKVDIVTHSMGGLVARSYIQSNNFENDVEKIVLLGTPNHGSSDMYSVWEGGIVPKNWGTTYKTMLDAYLWYFTHTTKNTASQYETIHQYIPSLGEMMPTYGFLEVLDLTGSTTSVSYSDMNVTNPFLENLDNNLYLFQTRVVASNISGIDKGTVGTVTVEPAPGGAGVWQDGEPNPFPPPRNDTEGDNRVLDSSVDLINIFVMPAPGMPVPPSLPTEGFIEMDNYRRGSFSDTSHTELPYKSIAEVIYWFNRETPTFPSPFPQPMPPAEQPITLIPDPYPEFEDSLSFFFTDNVEPKIIAPDGTYIDTSTSTIPFAEFDTPPGENGPTIINIPNPQEGEYKIEIEGLNDTDYDFAVYYADDEGSQIEDFSESIGEGEEQSFEIQLDLDEIEPIETSDNFDINDLIELVKQDYLEGLISDDVNCTDPYLNYEKIKEDYFNNLIGVKMGFLDENRQVCLKLKSFIETDDNDYQSVETDYNILIKAFQENNPDY